MGGELAKRGHNVTYIATDLPIASLQESVSLVEKRIGTDRPSGSEVRVFDGVTEETIPSSRSDVFVATAWWTAHAADGLIKNGYNSKSFFYLIQDHEPNFYAWGDEYAGAKESYGLGFVPLFNTTILKSYFEQKYPQLRGIGYAFRPSVPFRHYTELVDRRPANVTRLAVYGRPDVPRNMFGTIVEGLARFVVEAKPAPEQLDLVSVGMSHADVELPRGHELKSVGKIPFHAYPRFLSTVHIGVSLMHSPHPSYPPLEMAAAGARVLTNRFGGKDLSLVSGLVTNVQPTVGDLASNLCRIWSERAFARPASAEERLIKLESLGPSLGECVDFVSEKIRNECLVH